MILSFLVMIITMNYMQSNLPEPEPGLASPVRDAEDGLTTLKSRPRMVEPDAAPELRQIRNDTGTHVAAAGPDRSSIPTLPIETEVYSIEFSPVGGVPVRWDIIDERFTPPPMDNGGDDSWDETENLVEHLIDPAIVEHPSLDLPFQIILRGLNSRFFHEFNRDMYEAEILKNPDGVISGYSFRSPRNELGLVMVKTWRFPDSGSFRSTLEISLENHGSSNLSFNNKNTGLGLLLGPGLGSVPNTDNMPPMTQFARTDAILKSPVGFEYAHLSDDADPVVYSEEPLQWAGIQSMYFLAAIIPGENTSITSARMFIDRDVKGTLAADNKEADFYPSLEIFTDQFNIPFGTRLSFVFDLYMGPKQPEILREAGHDLERVLFHDSWNWFRGLCLALMIMLTWFQGMVGNWGVSIIFLTFTVRLLTFPLVHKGLKAQAKTQVEMQKLKPLMDKINEKHKDDPRKKQQEVMSLYREHGVNPLGALKGCGWMLIQMPIFFALYKLLYQSIDLRGASWWFVQDLSQPDRLFMLPWNLPLVGDAFNILPLFVAATQMVTSKFTMQTPTDPQQAQMQKMMIYFMPVMILVLTYSFPSGLMLYWMVSNLWQVVQQLWVNKHIRKPQQQGVGGEKKA